MEESVPLPSEGFKFLCQFPGGDGFSVPQSFHQGVQGFFDAVRRFIEYEGHRDAAHVLEEFLSLSRDFRQKADEGKLPGVEAGGHEGG